MPQRASDADHTMDSEDKTMYCAHYADTEPTDMAGTIMAGSATDMAIEALFDKRYILIDDAMTMEYEDMGLMPETKYTYRVSAVNSVGRSPWSAPAMATTVASNMAPTVSSIPAVMVMVGDMSDAITLGDYFSDADGDDLTYGTPTSSNPAVATAAVGINDDDPGAPFHTLTVTGHMAGEATITVTATDPAGASATQTIAGHGGSGPDAADCAEQRAREPSGQWSGAGRVGHRDLCSRVHRRRDQRRRPQPHEQGHRRW